MREYVKSLTSYIATEVNIVKQDINNILKVFNFDESNGEAYYFIDKDENVIAYIDRNGIHATNLLLEHTFDDNG